MTTLVAPNSVAMDPAKLAKVEELFHHQIESGMHPGAGLTVYRYGNLVLDLQGGQADAKKGQPVDDETMFVLFSSTKPLAAACLYILKERGKLAWEDQVCKYWPKFADNGKEGVTIGHILTHRGGFPETPKTLPWTDWSDWDKVVRAMEEAEAIYTPGEVLAYHPVNYGWVIAELVRLIDGRLFNVFFAEELTSRLGMNATYVGLPANLENHVSRIHLMEDDADPNGYAKTFDLPEVHLDVVPGAGGIASASDLARFYSMMERGGTLDGTQVLMPETVKEVTALQVEATDVSLGLYSRRSLAFSLADERMGASKGNPDHTFGHGGAGTSVGWADSDSGLAVGFITNGFRGSETNNARLNSISQAIRDACD